LAEKEIKTMFPILGTYLSIIAFCMMILSTVLIPALIS
jgi:hypothetical protein